MKKQLHHSIYNIALPFDLQHCATVIQLQAKPDIFNKFVFGIAELQFVFTVLKMLGKMINVGVLNQAFQEAGTKTTNFHLLPELLLTLDSSNPN